MFSSADRNNLRILIVRPNHRLGNNILLTPLLKEIGQQFPAATVEIVTGGGASRDLYEGFPQVVAVHAFPAWSYSQPLRVIATLRGVLGRPYDLAIDPLPGSRSARLMLGVVKARDKIGFRWPGRWLGRWLDAPLTHSVEGDAAPAHYAQAPVHLLRSATRAAAAYMPTLDLFLSAAERSAGRVWLDEKLPATDSGGMRVGLYCAATGAKQYSIEWWQRFAEALLRERTAESMQLIEFLPHDGKSAFAGSLPNVLSLNLRELAAALSAIDVFITADCGVMHLASAAGTQTLGLFKVTDAKRYGPYGNRSASIAATDNDPVAAARQVAACL